MKNNKLRPLGQITTDIEPLLQELVVDHELQYHEILNLIFGYLQTHYPDARETYVDDGSHPVLFYGHSSNLK